MRCRLRFFPSLNYLVASLLNLSPLLPLLFETLCNCCFSSRSLKGNMLGNLSERAERPLATKMLLSLPQLQGVLVDTRA